MGCSSCSTGKDGQPRGCKNNGTCGTDGCNKLTVFDWLSNMTLPNGHEPFDCVEVRFKNSRKEFFRNTEGLTLSIGDVVATESSPGHDVGIVTLVGELVKVQMKKKGTNPEDPALPKIYRKASQKDIDIWQAARDREAAVQKRSREIAISLGLEMKISDVEFQGDGSKATFYYTAEGRVDFRQLIKDMARAFNTRIEMRQIGYRQEASRLGGIGSCGRELCCSTWLTDFRSVNTASARYQQLSLNPQKLAGQCGKLKCCLNYELDAYLDALREFPKQDIKLDTEKGFGVCQKIDIFKGLMWYAYEGDWAKWHMLSVDQAQKIIAQNREGAKVTSLEDFSLDLPEQNKKEFENVVGQDSLTRFDRPKKRNKGSRPKKRTAGKGGDNRSKQQRPAEQDAQVSNRKDGNKGDGPKGGRSSKGGSRRSGSRSGGPKGNTPKGNAPKGDQPKGNAPKEGGPKGSAPKGNAPKGNAPKGGRTKGNGPKGGAPNQGDAKSKDNRNPNKRINPRNA